MPVTVEDLKNPQKKFSIKVNETMTDCDVDPNGIQRKAINGEMLTLYMCTTTVEVSDKSGFWIHKDCLKLEEQTKKIRENTFPENDKRYSLNDKGYSELNSKNDYKWVTVDEGVSRKEFLRKIEHIYLREGGEREQQLASPVQPPPKPLALEEEAQNEEAQPPPTAQPEAPPPPPAQPAQQETKYDFTGIFNEISLTNEQKQGGIDELIAILKENNMNENFFIKTTQNELILLSKLEKQQYKFVSEILLDPFGRSSDLGLLENDASVIKVELKEYKLKE